MWHVVREPLSSKASDHARSVRKAFERQLDEVGILRAVTEDEARDILIDRRLRRETVQPTGSEILDLRAEPAPARKPPTPQIPNEPGTKYILPSFVTAEHVTRDAPPAEPELSEATDLTAARLSKLAKKIPSMADADHAATRARIDELMAQMEADGRKIAEHCIEVGGKFSLRG